MTITVDVIHNFCKKYQRKIIHDTTLKPAGVLIPIYEQEDDLLILFTKRTEEVEHHKGQISFPGGVVDINDSNIIETALRETNEEIGLDRNKIEVLGLLDDYQTPSGFCITPVVGWLTDKPRLVINQTEVKEVFSVPLNFFLNPENEKKEQRVINGKIVDIYFYNYHNYEIWGATAAILRNFLKSVI